MLILTLHINGALSLLVNGTYCFIWLIVFTLHITLQLLQELGYRKQIARQLHKH